MAAASSISDAGGMISFAFLAWISSGGVLSSFYLLKHADEANAEADQTNEESGSEAEEAAAANINEEGAK